MQMKSRCLVRFEPLNSLPVPKESELALAKRIIADFREIFPWRITLTVTGKRRRGSH